MLYVPIVAGHRQEAEDTVGGGPPASSGSAGAGRQHDACGCLVFQFECSQQGDLLRCGVRHPLVPIHAHLHFLANVHLNPDWDQPKRQLCGLPPDVRERVSGLVKFTSISSLHAKSFQTISTAPCCMVCLPNHRNVAAHAVAAASPQRHRTNKRLMLCKSPWFWSDNYEENVPHLSSVYRLCSVHGCNKFAAQARDKHIVWCQSPAARHARFLTAFPP